MNRKTLGACAAAALITSVSPSPALAQSHPYPAPGGIAAGIERGAQIAAEAVTALSYALRGTRENIAMGACRIRAAQHGSATITEARTKGRDRLRVKGVIDASQYGAWGPRYERSYPRRSFTCTVRYDGSITKFKTKRLRG